MKNFLSSIGILILCISCNPLSDGPKEEITGFHENGNLSYQYYIVEGKRDGVYKEYYPSGDLQIERLYSLDTIVSEKIKDINGKILVNYVIRDGRYYGLLGSSSCMSVFNEDRLPVQNRVE